MTLPLCSTGMGRRKSVATGWLLDFHVMIGWRSWCRPGKEPSTFFPRGDGGPTRNHEKETVRFKGVGASRVHSDEAYVSTTFNLHVQAVAAKQSVVACGAMRDVPRMFRRGC